MLSGTLLEGGFFSVDKVGIVIEVEGRGIKMQGMSDKWAGSIRARELG